jgi:hypothetical protein
VTQVSKCYVVQRRDCWMRGNACKHGACKGSSILYCRQQHGVLQACKLFCMPASGSAAKYTPLVTLPAAPVAITRACICSVPLQSTAQHLLLQLLH